MSTTKRSQAKILRAKGRVDLKRVRAATAKDIKRWIAEDPDTAQELPPNVRIRAVYTPPIPNVRQIREQLNLTQAKFAQRFGLAQRTIEQWEQGRAVPDRPARILLAVIQRDPRVVQRAIAGSRKP
jgi:putative transcriptional regulator